MSRKRTPRPPPPPADLNPAAKARWTAVVPMFQGREVDLDALRTYCQLWARWREAEDGIAKTGQLTKAPGGRVVASPLLAIANQAATQVRALEDRLGIGPGGARPAEPEPTGELLTRRELAARLDIHMQTVCKWERDGMPIAQRGRKGKPSLYRETDVRAWRDAREAAAQKAGLVDVAQERARKERAQAILAEQAYRARERELLPAADVERAWNAEVQAVRAAILATYTTQADRIHRAAVLEGVSGVEAELKSMAHELLRELSAPARTETVATGQGAVA